MFNYFVFDGHDSRDYGVYISGGGTFNSPARQYENISVPGRDGDLLGASTRLQNVTLTYPAGVVSDFAANIEGLRNMLLSTVGYAVLYDSYHPDEYRYAVYKGGLEQDPLSNLQAGEFEITFECKPQRYLFSGGEARDLGTWGEVTELTGDIVTFEGAADTGIKTLTVQIEPVQSGSGDPSPSNVRPISGHTGVTVTRTGKNLLDASACLAKSFINTSGGVSTSDDWSASDYISVKSGQTYTLSGVTNTGWTATHSFYNAEKAFISYVYAINNSTFTVPDGAFYVRLSLRDETPTEAQFELGSTATAYEPYTAESFPITFPDAAGTVYGGTVDVTTGKLKVTKASTILTGSNNWSVENGGMRIKTSDLADVIQHNSANNTTIGAICNMFEEKTPNQTWAGGSSGIGVSVAPNGDVAFCQTGEQSMGWSAWINFVNSNTLQLVYPLATPIEYDLTPEQITTLKGSNNIWADTGPITLEYGKDPGKLVNPTLFDARPVFRVFGYGTLNVGNQTVTIAQNPLDYIDIDSALMDCYCGATNANQYVTFSGNDFPVLPPGVTSITFSNTITQVLVTTNWWRV